jgi:kynurenine formamidase
MKLFARFFCMMVSLSALLNWGGRTIAQEQSNNVTIDLTHPFNESTIYWPTEEGFKLLRGPAGVTNRGYFYAANRFMCAEHGGTHIDAPVHFWKGGQTVDEVPLARLIRPGACVDVSQKCDANRDYQVRVEDFEAWEAVNSTSLQGKIVLVRTGFALRWPDRKRYLGTAETGRAGVANLHVARRKIRAVGIDTASIDYGQTQDYPSHQRLFRDNVPALENVKLPSNLPALGFTVVALPMKISGGSGAPCRIVAIIND